MTNMRIADVNELRRLIIGSHMESDFDIRPFHVVMRCLQSLGYTPKIGDTDDAIYLAGVRGQRRVSIAKMLYMCRDACREAQNSDSSFARMCAEEDEEEIALVLELYRRTAGMDEKTPNAEYRAFIRALPGKMPQREEAAPTPVVISDENQKDWEAVKKVLPYKKPQQARTEDLPPYILF